MKITPKLTGCTLIKHKNKKHAKHALKTLMSYLTKAPVTLSTFIHKVIFFTGHLVVAPGKCEFTTLIKFKHKKVEFPVL